MDTKRILDMVANFSLWQGNVYRLATHIAAEQRETDAAKAEAAGYPELAEQIRLPTEAPEPAQS